jgi:hypothetical protein
MIDLSKHIPSHLPPGVHPLASHAEKLAASIREYLDQGKSKVTYYYRWNCSTDRCWAKWTTKTGEKGTEFLKLDAIVGLAEAFGYPNNDFLLRAEILPESLQPPNHQLRIKTRLGDQAGFSFDVIFR